MDINLKRLRQRCRQRLRELDLPNPFDAHAFCELLAVQRGRAIVLRSMEMGTGPSGAWVTTPWVDAIFYERETSVLHREQIILHEACHMVWGHKPIQLSESDTARLLFPELEPEVAQRMLQRAGYSSEEEREAELLASMILEHVGASPPSSGSGPRIEKDRVLHRLEASLEEERDER